jgi:hypothetical protein
VTGALCYRWQEAKEEVVQGQGYAITISIAKSYTISTLHPTVTTISNFRRALFARTETNGNGIVESEDLFQTPCATNHLEAKT